MCVSSCNIPTWKGKFPPSFKGVCKAVRGWGMCVSSCNIPDKQINIIIVYLATSYFFMKKNVQRSMLLLVKKVKDLGQ